MRDSGRSAGGNGKRSGDLELRMALPCPWPPPLPLFALYTLAVLFPHRPLLPVSGSPAPASGSTIVLFFSLGLHPSHRNWREKSGWGQGRGEKVRETRGEPVELQSSSLLLPPLSSSLESIMSGGGECPHRHRQKRRTGGRDRREGGQCRSSRGRRSRYPVAGRKGNRLAPSRPGLMA